MKKIAVVLYIIFSVLGLSAQQTTGLWTVYPVIGSDYDKVIDTESKVFFLTSSFLYSYDKETNETYFYNSSNKLSSSGIKNIFYNHDKDYMIIVYADNNMDMLCDNGHCYNLPEIKDANMTDDKTINDIAFGHDRFAVATNFGLVIYDDNKREVAESGIYRQAIEAVDFCGDNIVIYSPYLMMFSPVSERHNTINSFKVFGGTYTNRVLAVNDNMVVWPDLNSNCLTISKLDFETPDRNNEFTSVKVDGPIMKCKDGFYFKSGDKVLIYDNEAKQIDSFELSNELKNNKFAFWEGKNSVWMGGQQGTANFDFSSSEPVIKSDWYTPEAVNCKIISYFFLSPDGNRIYLSNLCPTIVRTYLATRPDGVGERQYTNVIENGNIRDVAIINASAKSSGAINAQKANNSTAMYGGVTRLAEDPNDPETYYIGNGQEGIYVVKNREEIWKFDVDNTPFLSYWNTRIFDVNFDPQGNLWAAMSHFDKDHSPYIMLPASKLRKGFENITNEDWVWIEMKDFNAASKDYISLFTKKTPFAFFINGSTDMCVINTKGTYDNVKDDVCYLFTSYIDQDGGTIKPESYFTLAEDMNGRVWVGTGQGIFYFSNPATINDNATVVRPKVPRNDGTNYADYLLDSEQINSIAVDPSNRKWIATDFSGVYLVSENGDKIIKHFDTSNSPLPSNRVTAVICDPHSNIVYFGTTEGLYSYRGDSSPAQSDFNEVYAYPNPVRPDYTGWITIAGLMDNSLVKITDAAGNVFYQGRSEGGMMTWDGCNSAGERVRSGIYYVYASSGGDGQTSSGVVTKIMVVN